MHHTCVQRSKRRPKKPKALGDEEDEPVRRQATSAHKPAQETPRSAKSKVNRGGRGGGQVGRARPGQVAVRRCPPGLSTSVHWALWAAPYSVYALPLPLPCWLWRCGASAAGAMLALAAADRPSRPADRLCCAQGGGSARAPLPASPQAGAGGDWSAQKKRTRKLFEDGAGGTGFMDRWRGMMRTRGV